MSRGGSLSELIVPKFEFPKVWFGLLKWARLAMLKKPASICNLRFSAPSVLSFAMDRSVLLIPGPRTWPTPELPNVYAGGAVKQPVLNHCCTLFEVGTLEQVMSATLLPLLLFRRLLATVILRGCPD